MTTSISERDWVELSAYLDGQLAPGEKRRLERNLQSRADLRAAMAELQRTRKLLRNQPPIRAPRNFTLSPRLVESQQRRRLFSGLFQTLRLASVAASMLFVLVLLGDLFIPKAGAVVPMAAMPAESIPMEQSVQEEALAEVPESLEVTEAVEVEKEAERALDASDATPDVGTALGLPMVNAQPMTSTETMYPAPEEMPAIAEPVLEEGIPIESPTATELALGDSTALETPPEAQPKEGFGVLKATEGEKPAKPEAQETPAGVWTTWRIFEVGLAIVGLAAGIIAILLRVTGRA